jgi:Schlafen, AlbA_2
MALSSISFEDISERDLLDQIQTGVPEGVLLDYKRETYGGGDADVKEFLKDVSSFANTAGGHLIIGIDETGGVPTAISALDGDSDKELQRLENLARDGIEPRIVGLRMRAVPIIRVASLDRSTTIKAGGWDLDWRLRRSDGD